MSYRVVRPRGMVMIFALLVIIALGALCTMATSLMHSSNQFVELHEQDAVTQMQVDSALEEVVAALNAKGVAALSTLNAKGVASFSTPQEGYSIQHQLLSGGTLAIRVRAEHKTLDVQLAKSNERWHVSSYRIVE